MVREGRGLQRSQPGPAKLSWVAVLIVVVSLLFGTALAWRHQAPPAAPVGSASPSFDTAVAARREISPTLDPALFVGKAALAHRVAREIPDVLEQLYCYCGCDKSVGHKRLLSCFTDGHAAT